jgi:choline dehydrogenase-like flavoprotein
MTGREREYDVLIIGSGMGGILCAGPLVRAGLRVGMLERGDWVPRDMRSQEASGSLELTPFFSADQAYGMVHGRRIRLRRATSCVGGQAVFFGGVALRYREEDFLVDPAIAGDSGACWPFGYDAFEPYYAATERVLDVAGDPGGDPTAPWRSDDYPQEPAALSPIAQRLAAAGRQIGLEASRLPLTINYRPGPSACVRCGSCDSYACGLGAKNDPAARVLPELLTGGLDLRPRTVAVRLEQHAGRVTGVVCFDLTRGAWVTYRASAYVLAAGALATPHLLLASGLERLNPAGHAVGRYLLRHVNAIVFGVFPRPLEGHDRFHKQLAFFGHYLGAGDGGPEGRRGLLQQLHSPPRGLVRAHLPGPLGALGCAVVPRMTGLLAIAEDQPRAENRITLDHSVRDRYGLPRALVLHTYSERDRAARAALVRTAGRLLRRAGAVAHYVHRIDTFSHAVGTVRMGADAATAPLDADGRFRGVANLFVADGSALPSAAAVNPALTIGANALRVGARVRAALLSEEPSHVQKPRTAAAPRVLRMRPGHRHA